MPSKGGRHTPQERAFVGAMVQAGNPTVAAHMAGYKQPSSMGGVLMRRPEIAAAVQAEMTHVLQTEGARVGVGTLLEIAGDKNYAAGARVLAARELVKLSGVGADTADDEKSPDQMSRAELEAAARSIRSKLADLDNVIDVEPTPKSSVFD